MKTLSASKRPRFLPSWTDYYPRKREVLAPAGQYGGNVSPWLIIALVHNSRSPVCTVLHGSRLRRYGMQPAWGIAGPPLLIGCRDQSSNRKRRRLFASRLVLTIFGMSVHGAGLDGAPFGRPSAALGSGARAVCCCRADVQWGASADVRCGALGSRAPPVDRRRRRRHI